jgi:hypothetical protein
LASFFNRSSIMTPLAQAVSPLRQRMLDDMRMRKLGGKTQAAYVRAVYRLAAFLQGSPDTASAEDLRRFQLDMVDGGTSPIKVNATITGLKFFFDITLDRAELVRKMQPVQVPHVLPVVLSRDEVARLIAAAPHLKYRAALSLAYGAGLRASEVAALIRHYRLLANAGRKANIAQARQLLPPTTDAPACAQNAAGEPAPPRPTFVCRHCGTAMTIIDTFERGQAIRAPPPCAGQHES